MAATSAPARSTPRPTLSTVDAVGIIVGIVVGAGIFRSPSLVAANAGSEALFMLAWLLGGLVSLAGALCYAELASAYPHAGGDYHYLTRAFGKEISFLFAWARMTVIQTGSIATAAFVFGDYASEVYRLGGSASPGLYAAAAVALLTALNMAGIRQGKSAQNVLSLTKVAGLFMVVAAGILLASGRPEAAVSGTPPRSAFGLAMIFVLYTYGGWNEAAYISAEVRDGRRNILRSLLWGVFTVTALYLLVNLAYLWGLGLAGVGGSKAVAADLLGTSLGAGGAACVGILVAISALGATSGTILTGARANYALGLDTPTLGFLGRWNERTGTPVPALGVQGAIALVLVLLGALTRRGFETMVDYSVPVFWFFLLLTGLALFVLRAREPEAERPFRVPLYPVTPMLFCVMCLYMLHASLSYAGVGALVGLGVLAAGIPALLHCQRRSRGTRKEPPSGV